jgi:hypothetical protein
VRGASFMAIGLRDPVLGKPVMEELRAALAALGVTGAAQ